MIIRYNEKRYKVYNYVQALYIDFLEHLKISSQIKFTDLKYP